MTVSVFGSLNLEVYAKPEQQFEDLPGVQDQLVEVSQSAFNKDGVPTREDVVNHLLPVSTVVTLDEDGDYIGFSATARRAGTVYEEGIALDQDYQGFGLGKLMLSRSILEEMEKEGEGESVVTYRTQNPRMYASSMDVFDAFPKPGEDTPPELEEAITRVGEELDPEAVMDGPVMKEAYADIYDGGMYSHIPGHELEQFMNDLGVEFDAGDALVVAGQVTREEMENSYDSAARRTAYDLDDGTEVNPDAYTFTHGPR